MMRCLFNVNAFNKQSLSVEVFQTVIKRYAEFKIIVLEIKLKPGKEVRR